MNRVHFHRSAEADIYLWQQKMRAKHSQLSGQQRQEVADARQRAEKRMAWAASEKRLGKEIRAYAKLDEINEQWKQRTGRGSDGE